MSEAVALVPGAMSFLLLNSGGATVAQYSTLQPRNASRMHWIGCVGAVGAVGQLQYRPARPSRMVYRHSPLQVQNICKRLKLDSVRHRFHLMRTQILQKPL